MVAVDPTSCVAEIERGVPTRLPEDATAGEEGGGGKTEQADKGKKGGAALLAGDVGDEGQNRDGKATFWYIYEDPIDLAVNRVRTSVRTRVKNHQIESAKCRWYWSKLTESGWQRDIEYHDFDCNVTNNKATAVDSEHFYNDTFASYLCSSRQRTHTYYFHVTTKVTRNNPEGFVDVTWAQGGCASFLEGVTFWEPGVFYN